MDRETSPTGESAVAAALRLIKDSLFALGAEGDDCIQKLVAIEAGLPDEPAFAARKAVFRAFHEGLTATERSAPWRGDARLRGAYDTGARVAQLNDIARTNSGLNRGPFDLPGVQAALKQAARAIDGDLRTEAPATSPLPIPRRKS